MSDHTRKTSRRRRQSVAALIAGFLTTFGTADAFGQLVPQLSRCVPLFGDTGPVETNQTTTGIYNTIASRKPIVRSARTNRHLRVQH